MCKKTYTKQEISVVETKIIELLTELDVYSEVRAETIVKGVLCVIADGLWEIENQ
jgi:hypothetical protein